MTTFTAADYRVSDSFGNYEEAKVFVCVKSNKRLWIREEETGVLLYTLPDFLRHRLQGREPMMDLARKATERGELHIFDIMEFEEKIR